MKRVKFKTIVAISALVLLCSISFILCAPWEKHNSIKTPALQQGNGTNTSDTNSKPQNSDTTSLGVPNSDIKPDSGSTNTSETKPDNTVQSCSYCNKTGHLVSSCPTKAADEAPCSYCNKTGHKVASCPTKAADEAPCSYCKKTGHKIASCPTKAADEAPCSYCKKTGHKISSCPTKAADEAPCSYCKKTGHKESACEKKKADAFDINYWVQYAKDYAVSIGLKLDPAMAKDISCWDAPIAANYKCIYLERDITGYINFYKDCISYYGFAGYIWAWAEEIKPGDYNLYIFYA